MPTQIRRAAVIKMTYSDFINFIDSIYFDGYAVQMEEANPEKLQFEFAEFIAINS